MGIRPHVLIAKTAQKIIKPHLVIFLMTTIAFTLAGCKKEAGPTGTPKTEIRVAAAANMKFAFDEIVSAFQAQNHGIQVTVTYGSSGNLFAQLSNKAPFDVLLSADVEYPRKLIEAGLAAEDAEFIYAVGRIVLWVPNSSKLDIDKLGLAALVDRAVRKVAIANPKHAPYGRAAEAALKKSGVHEKVEPRLVFGENVEQAGQFVQSGAADAAIIPLSLALSPALNEQGRHWLVPQTDYPPLEQAGIILSWAKDVQAAEKLRAFLLSPPGREILKRYGYGFPAKS
jgi:molybdate transport system substrate-binding protein